jgi:hypothetical protein
MLLLDRRLHHLHRPAKWRDVCGTIPLETNHIINKPVHTCTSISGFAEASEIREFKFNVGNHHRTFFIS